MTKGRIIAASVLSLALIASACAKPATPAPAPVKAPAVATPAPAKPAAPTPRVVAPTPTPAPKPVAKPTGELRVGVGYVGTETLDPIAGPMSGIVTLAEPIYDFLVGVSAEGKLSKETGLASDWKMSPDAKKWTFYLKKGIKFQNGDEITAEDAKFTIERVLSKRSLSTNVSAFRKAVDRVEVADPYTLVVYTKTPLPLFVYYVSHLMPGVEGMVVPKKYIEQVGEDEFTHNPIGSGPYRFKQQVFGSYVTLEAVDQHWRVGVPQFKTITVLAIPETATRVAALKLGQADLIELEREAIPEVKAAGFRVVERPRTDHLRFFFLQQWDPGPLNDKRVRLALVLGTNRDEIIKYMFQGMGKPASVAFMSPFTIGYDPDLKPWPYDPERAKQLLAEAGYPNGFSIDMYAFQRPGFPELPKVAEAMTGYWEKIGVKVKLIPTDYGAFRPLWRGKKLTGGALAISTAATRTVSQPSHLRYHNYDDKLALADDPDIRSLVEQAGAALTLEEMAEKMRQAHRLMYERVTFPAVASLSRTYAIGPKIESWTPRQVPYSLSLDAVKPKK